MAELKDLTNHESVLYQIKQYHNLISLDADQLQDLKARIKELDNGDYEHRSLKLLTKLSRNYMKHLQH